MIVSYFRKLLVKFGALILGTGTSPAWQPPPVVTEFGEQLGRQNNYSCTGNFANKLPRSSFRQVLVQTFRADDGLENDLTSSVLSKVAVAWGSVLSLQ